MIFFKQVFSLNNIANRILYLVWLCHCYFAKNQSINVQKTTVAILACYHVERMKNIEPLIRSILKCNFIDKVILTNHNPTVFIEDWVKIKDERLKVINQPVRRGPGYCWNLADKEDSQFFILIDDDFLVSPRQIKILFQHLLDEPDIPHGITGHLDGNYYQNKEMEVDKLNQIYAISREHLTRYLELTEKIRVFNQSVYELIEPFAHEVIISKTGINRPKIHRIGLLTRCPTARKPGVAIHRRREFLVGRQQVISALDRVMHK